ELQQAHGGFGHVVERETVAVLDRALGSRKGSVIERLHVVHRAGEAPCPPLGFGGQTPGGGERLEIAELRRKQSSCHCHASPTLRSCWSTQSPTVLWKWRTRIS